MLQGKWRTPQKMRVRDKAVKQPPKSVRIREKAAARCTNVIKRRVLKKQARKARADHLSKCSMMPGRRKMKRKPLSELYVNGTSRKAENYGKREWQRQCEEVCADHEETRKAQEQSIEHFEKEADISQTTEEEQRSRLTWCCRPGQRCQKTRSMDQKMQL